MSTLAIPNNIRNTVHSIRSTIADFRLLRKGTAYITDVGMCGNYDSVLGFEVAEPINRLARRYTGGRLSPAKGKGTLYGIVVDIDDKTGLANKIEQLKV